MQQLMKKNSSIGHLQGRKWWDWSNSQGFYVSSWQCPYHYNSQLLDDSAEVCQEVSWRTYKYVSKSLFTLDNYLPHKYVTIKETAKELETYLVFIPAGCTSIAQPLHVSANPPFKAKMTDLWEEWRWETDSKPPQGNLKHRSRKHAINWVSALWSLTSCWLAHSLLTWWYFQQSSRCTHQRQHTRNVVGEEDDSGIKDPFQDLDEEDTDDIASFSNSEDWK